MGYFTSLLIYMASFGTSLIMCSIYQSIYKKNGNVEPPVIIKAIWFLLIIAAPVYISAIRFAVGTDYFTYIEIYQRINSWPFETAWSFYGNEPLYFFLNKFTFLLFNAEWGVFFLSAFLIHIFIIMGIDYFKKDISMTMALFIYFMLLFNFGLNGIRQTIAMAIVFFSIRYIHKRKLLTYIIFIIIATMFHNTAIIFLVFYLLSNKKKRLFSKVSTFIYYIGIISTPIILVIAINIFKNISIFADYSHYISNTKPTIRIGFLLYILPIIIPIFLYKKQILANNKSYELIFDLLLLNIPFQYLGYYIDWGNRLVLYTNTLYLIFVPLVVGSIKRREDKIIIAVYFILYFMIIYLTKYLIGNSSNVFPYDSIIW